MGGRRACDEGGRSKVDNLGGVRQKMAFHSCVAGPTAWGRREEGGTHVEEVGDRENASWPCLRRWGSHSAYRSASCEEGRGEEVSVAAVLNLSAVVC